MTSEEAPETRAQDAAKKLGEYLNQVRRSQQLTLRDVEAKSGNTVTNGYLSQIEAGAVTRPSPNKLWHLAEVYGIDYSDLLERAGHKVPTSTVSLRGTGNKMTAGVSLRAIEELDPEDQEDLREYLAYLQARKKRRR